jgi:hypothetical protein
MQFDEGVLVERGQLLRLSLADESRLAFGKWVHQRDVHVLLSEFSCALHGCIGTGASVIVVVVRPRR